jgi:hypothetical protein
LKKEQLASKFYDEAYALLEMIKQQKENTKDFRAQYQKVFNSFKDIPSKENDADNRDIEDVINWTSYRLGKPVDEITRDEFTSYLDSKLFSSPRNFDFYFRIGETSGFTDGYVLGNGKLYPFNKLPPPIQNHLRNEFPHLIEEDRAYEGENLDNYVKRREQEWYLHIQVQSVGHYKAREKAITNAKRNVNILKLIYNPHGSLFDYNIQSPFDYLFQIDGSIGPGGGYQHKMQSIFFSRIDALDKMVGDMTSIMNSKNPTALDRRILNVVDVFGLIDDLTPLHVRFLLCIVSLENLLLDERDYLGWKLAEKISYLVGDTRAWFATHYKIDFGDEQKLKDMFTGENIARARIALDETIHDFYDKRSDFAHRGLESKPSKRITVNDYYLASSILMWTVEKLLELRRDKNIDHIPNDPRDGREDNASLNYYLQKMKYR